ncbi:hypothetical protein Poli38472_014500 [Pythium oligandrum]|uniref:Uncharacterized protein n=1 Tax=Pythium oligandrum TaxID=41045 RepID=A0A8K1CDH2_PYTOL|nr:hypothetical protein Poli38472_014500 [Pythium oligandrum]|eukprot:TMW61039.1 hypothetical protein Poli38472_014500 [Pythium oligandrum]
MESTATAFVTQFADALFTQWTQQTSDKTLFWSDAKFVQNVLEEGVAKLPKVALKGHLTRDLNSYVERLQTLLHKQYVAYQQQHADKQSTEVSSSALLNEEDVERALATADDASRARIHGILASDDAVATQIDEQIQQATRTSELAALVEQSAQQLAVLRARRFEADDQVDRKSGFFLRQIVAGVHAIAQRWCQHDGGRWTSDAVESTSATERERLRVVLYTVATEAVTSAQTTPAQPWTSFFRPQEGVVFRSVSYENELAKLFGTLLALVVAFPLVDEDEEDDANTSDESSDSDSSDDESSSRRKSLTKGKKTQPPAKLVECVTLAKQVTRLVALAAKQREDADRRVDWLLNVLSAFHAIAKPTQLVSEDDEDDDVLSATQRRGLQDCVADLYARAFTQSSTLWTRRQGNSNAVALLRTILCLRYAAEFLCTERKAGVPAVTTAATELVGVSLPPSFWRWMAQVKKIYAGEHAVVQRVMKTLTKHKTNKKMANVLLSESTLSLSDLRTLVEQFEVYVTTEKERDHFVVSRVPSSAAQPVDEETEDGVDDVLFFVDPVGGKSKRKDNSTQESQKRARTETQ